MPIRLNLLAEAQALEDMRRRDPVKRAGLIGGVLVAAMLLYSGSLLMKTLVYKKDLAKLQREVDTHSSDFKEVLGNQKKIGEIEQKLTALQNLATNRFLAGNVLNALQQATVDGVQLTRLKIGQSFIFTEEVKPVTSGNRTIPGKPATVVQKTTLVLDAKDFSATQGDAIPKFRQKIAEAPYFQMMLDKSDGVRLREYGTTQIGKEAKPFLPFTIECRYPEKTR